MCCWLSVLLQSSLLLLLQFRCPVLKIVKIIFHFAKMPISPLTAMLTMCCWLLILLRAPLLLHLLFGCTVQFQWDSVIGFLKATPTFKCNVVNVVLIFNASPTIFTPSFSIWLPFEFIIFCENLLICAQILRRLTPKFNSFNVLLIVNAVAIFSAPGTPISFAIKFNVINVLLVANASAIFSAPYAPILLDCEY